MRIFEINIKNENLDLEADLAPQFVKVIEQTLALYGYDNVIVFPDKLTHFATQNDDGYMVGCHVDFPSGTWINVKNVQPPKNIGLEIKIADIATQNDVVYQKHPNQDRYGFFDAQKREYFNISHFRVIFKSVKNMKKLWE